MPRLSGCDAGTPPIPSSVTAIGMPARSASSEHVALGARLHDAVAGENQRPLGVVDQLDRVAVVAVAGQRFVVRLGQVRLGRRPVHLAARLLRVLRDVDQHRARAARLRDGERLENRRRDVLRARHQVVVLRDRQRDARDVGFLKRVGSDQLAAHLAGDADDRRAVHHRGGDAGDHVGRARPGRRNGDADLAARARVAVGHVRRALLVPDEDVADRIAEHRVVRGQNRPARIAEDIGHPLAHQRVPDNLRTCQCHVILIRLQASGSWTSGRST